MKKTKKLLILFFTAILFVGCATTPISDRKQLIFLSSEEEVAMGAESFQEILAESKLSTNQADINLLKKVGKKIAAQIDADYDWEFVLIEDEQVNAFCLPGGKVAVYTGILPVTKTEEGLAVVVSHEIGHAIARHGAERMSQNMIVGLGALAIGLGTGSANRDKYLAAYGVGSTVAVMLPYSRKHEYEADYIGLILMVKAGYNPNSAISFWQRMKDSKENSTSNLEEFLSTHPTDEKRIKRLEEHMPEALQYYQKSQTGYF